MAIVGQELIQIGAQNSPTNSDSLWTAFNKTQNNFSKLFSESSQFNTFTGEDGIEVTANAQTGTVRVRNTGVLNILPGTGISLSGSNGNVVLSVSGSGSGNVVAGVTSVGILSNTLTVTNTPVISTGNILLDLPILSNIIPGQYRTPTVTIDQYGRITSIANNVIAGTVTSVAVTSNDGIEVSGGPITSNGTITLRNTGVTRINAGAGILVTENTGNITISSTNPGGGAVAAAGASGSDSQIQYNSFGSLGGSAGLTFNDSTNTLSVTNLTVNGNVGSDLLPSANVTYDLGSSTQRWKDLWLSGNTIYLGTTASISATPTGAISLPPFSGAFLPSNSDSDDLGSSANSWRYTYTAITVTNSIRSAAAGNVGIVSNANDTGNTRIWDFKSNGDLKLPGNNSTITYANNALAFAQWVNAPGSNTAPGVPGQASYDTGGNLFVCVSTNTWAKFTGTVAW